MQAPSQKTCQKIGKRHRSVIDRVCFGSSLIRRRRPHRAMVLVGDGAYGNIEVTFEEVREHLGVETQRKWSDLAIGRTTPCLFGLFSLVALMALRLVAGGQLPVAQTAWYRKEQATFADVPAFVRRRLRAARYFLDSASTPQSTQFNPDVVDQLLGLLSEAV